MTKSRAAVEAEGRSYAVSMGLPNPDGQGKSLVMNVGWALAGNVGYTACQWGVLASIAKFGTASEVGRFALGLALTAPVITLANLHLRVIEATDARNDYPFRVYFSVRLLTTIIALVAIAIIALASGYRRSALALILAVALAKAFEAVSDLVFGLLQKEENLVRVATSMLAKGVLSVAAVALVLALTGDTVAAILAMALVWATVLVGYDLPAASRLTTIRPTLELASLGALAWLAAPMGCVAALYSFTINVPRYAIESNLGAAALGHFAAVAYLFVAGTQVMMALSAAVTPRLARHYATDLAAYRGLTRWTVFSAAALGVLAVAVAMIAGRAVLTIAYAPEYAQEAPVLVWLAVAAGVGFMANAVGYAVTAARRLSEQLPIAVASVMVAAVASSALVPRYGLTGAAWAVLATEGTRLLCLGIVYGLSLSSSVELPVCVAPNRVSSEG
jgi:O-antigen/teichoic acid export membrane protein